MDLGLPSDTVKLVPYSSQWGRLFQLEAQQLRAALGDYVADIQHIGSTAVPGIMAKPILDIAIALYRISDVQYCIAPLEALGYHYEGEQDEIKGWHFFTKGPGSVKTHHLHVVEHSSDFWVKRLLFRDYLRDRRDVAEEYVRLKQTLAEQFSNERKFYTAAKSEFINSVVAIAENKEKDVD
ncbi:MAG: GrpB family protein [Anaerolineae bacterium]|nr:GrpB family protein [Anaerolineae bacterium]